MDWKLSPDISVCLQRTGCPSVSWLSWRTSAWMIQLSWLHLRPEQHRPSVSPVTSTSSVWSATTSALTCRSPTLKTWWQAMTFSPTVTPSWHGVTCAENSSGVFISKVCAVTVGTFWTKSFSNCVIDQNHNSVKNNADKIRPVNNKKKYLKHVG